MGQQACNSTHNARAAIRNKNTPLDMMNDMILDGFKVKKNDRANYHPELMVGFPPKLLDITGKHVVGDLSLRSNENVIVRICRRETPL